MDCDVLFAEEFGITPAECITKEGEEEFRRKESELIAEISKKNSSVIATGGGAVLRTENILNLKKNGTIFFIDRSVGKLTATPDRPLSQSRELIEKRYAERYGKYLAAADCRIDGDGTAEEVAELIMTRRGQK